MKNIHGITYENLEKYFIENNDKKFRATQLYEFLYKKKINNLDKMPNIPNTTKELLKKDFDFSYIKIIKKEEDKLVKKYLFELNDGNKIESVLMYHDYGTSICVSSQVGCKMNCLFCQTGKQGWHGNLTTADILNQIYALPERDRLTNIVFMGQGEPMDNLDSVMNACDVLTSDWGFAWSPKRITVSSVGIKGKLKRFLDESECHIAISLHSPLHEQRLSLMPAEKAMPIAEIVSLLKQYDFSHQRRCSFEYICFGGMNDSMTFAREILQLLEGLECRVNLIRFHEIPGVALPSSDERRMESLRDYLTHHGVMTTIRASRGQDILAACGMLSTARQSKNLNKNS